MPLITRIQPNLKTHSIQEFCAVARLRFDEASRLAVAGDRLAAIYLGGYAAEMLLKSAYFRLTGRGQKDPISFQDISNVRLYAHQTFGFARQQNLHDLTYWTTLLVEERKRRTMAYPKRFARSLQAQVQRLYLNWREDLRYKANRPYQGEVTAVLRGVQWLLGQYRFL